MSNEDKNMGQQPMEFRRRPLGVTAVWYMGGEGSGLDVMRWIRRNNGTATFFAAVPAWVSESGDAGFEEQPEHIAMETVNGFAKAHTDSWVAKDSNGQFHIVDSETFEREFVQTSFPDGGGIIARYEALAEKLEKRHTPDPELLEVADALDRVTGHRKMSEYEAVSKSVDDPYEAWDI